MNPFFNKFTKKPSWRQALSFFYFTFCVWKLLVQLSITERDGWWESVALTLKRLLDFVIFFPCLSLQEWQNFLDTSSWNCLQQVNGILEDWLLKLFLVTFFLKEEEQVEERKILLVFEAFATNDLRISPPPWFPPCDVDGLDVGQDAQMKLTGEMFPFWIIISV